MERIGEYVIHRLIGEGGMGKVYEAEERLSKRRVALKVLRDDLARSEDGRRLFLREMTILSHLDHPNVVRCLACTEVGPDLVMVLEHMSGKTLRELLRERVRLPWSEVLRIAVDVAAGLTAAHDHVPTIIHRDLKPENIMILPDGRAKVMDFGIAKVLDAAAGQTVFTVGTLQYMSPEQIEGVTLDPRADLYCLGLLLYEMLAGQPPFASESPRALLNLHCTQPPPPLPPDVRHQLPAGLEALVVSLLAKDRSQRPPNAEATRRAIEQIQQGGAPSAAPTGHLLVPNAPAAPARSTGTIMLVERAGQAQRRGQTVGIILAIVGAVVVVVGGVAAWLLLGRGTPDEADRRPTPAAIPAPKAAAPAAPKPAAPVADPAKAQADRKAVQEAALREREANAAKSGSTPKAPAEEPKDPARGSSPGLLSRLGLGDDSGGTDVDADADADADEGGGGIFSLIPSPAEAGDTEAQEDDGAGGRLLDLFNPPGDGAK
jgi:serine/threonine-protein kinase